MRAGLDRRWAHRMLCAIASLALGVAHRLLAIRFAARGHGFHLPLRNALQGDRRQPVSPCPARPSFVVFDVAPVGHSLLFAVGAWPPQDGVRWARRLTLSRDLSRDLEALLPAGS